MSDVFSFLNTQLKIEQAKCDSLRTSEREGWRYADELEQERKRLTAELEALRADAERYRWLREAKSWPAAFPSCSAPEPLARSELDAAIDAARNVMLEAARDRAQEMGRAGVDVAQSLLAPRTIQIDAARKEAP